VTGPTTSYIYESSFNAGKLSYNKHSRDEICPFDAEDVSETDLIKMVQK